MNIFKILKINIFKILILQYPKLQIMKCIVVNYKLIILFINILLCKFKLLFKKSY